MSAVSHAPDVPDDVVDRIRRRRSRIRLHLDDAVDRRQRAYDELSRSTDPIDQAVAIVYRDFLLQVDEVVRSRAALLLAADSTGSTLVGRVAVFDDERDLELVPWHAPEGQRLITAVDRLLVTEQGDEVAVHPLAADERILAERIRGEMRASARREEMADPLATLTTEQGVALEAISTADRDVVLTGPPGSGKSAIAIVELARRVLTDPAPHELRVLFVTGTPRLAARAEALGRMLGVASITPVPQVDVLRKLGIGDVDTPIAGRSGAADGSEVPLAIEREFAALRDRLQARTDVPHPLGPTSCDDVAAVRVVRAEAAAKAYAPTAATLRRLLVDEYRSILPGERSTERAHAAAEILRPVRTATELVNDALGDGVKLPRPLRRAATAYARSLLEAPPRRRSTDWDLIVVDEYQRLPGLVLALLRRSTARLLLSGDPQQAFTSQDLAAGLTDTRPVTLTSSLRMPSAIAAWIDRFWVDHGLPAPAIRCAVEGGRVEELRGPLDAAARPGAQVVTAASAVRAGPDRASPLDALGLEWPEVLLVDPERILAEHGPAGLFVAATRAIDTLTVVRP